MSTVQIPVAVQERQLAERFHLNDPLVVQYFYWLAAFLQGNWGYTQTSIYAGPVLDAINLFFPNTLVLSVLSSILTGLIGIPLGVWSAVRKDSLLDQATRVISFAGYSIPLYWLGLASGNCVLNFKCLLMPQHFSNQWHCKRELD